MDMYLERVMLKIFVKKLRKNKDVFIGSKLIFFFENILFLSKVVKNMLYLCRIK